MKAATVRPFAFDARLFAEAVRGVASERPDEVGTPSTLLELPHPDGGLALFRVVEGRIVERWFNSDGLGILRQLGLAPPPGRR